MTFSRLACLCAGLLLWQTAAAQTFPVLRWQRFYGGPLDDAPCRLLKTAEGDLILAGTLTDAATGKQGAILRLTPKGDTVWAQTFGGKGHDLLLDATLHPASGDIFFCGGTGSDLKHQELSDAYYASDYWAGRMNAKGVLQWQRPFGGLLTDRAYGVAPTPDNGCFVVGGSWSADKPVTCPKLRTTDVWTARLDAAGQLKSADCWGGDQPDWGQCVTPHPDGGYVIAGFTASPELDSSRSRTYGDAWIRRVDASGAELWRNIIKEPYDDIIRRVIISRYGLIFAVGSAGTADKDRQFWWLALDAGGRVLHNVKFGGPGFDELTSVSECTNGDFVVSGQSFSTVQGARYFKGQADFWLMRLTAEGKVVWRQTFGGPDDEAAVDVLEYAPGVLYALGSKRNNDFGNGRRGLDFWLLKVEELPCNAMNVSFTTNITKTDAVKAGGTVRFVNKSAHGDEWLWYFGDGETSTDRSPTKRYNKPGTYFPKLEVRTGEGCRKVFVAPNPFVVVE